MVAVVAVVAVLMGLAVVAAEAVVVPFPFYRNHFLPQAKVQHSDLQIRHDTLTLKGDNSKIDCPRTFWFTSLEKELSQLPYV